MLFKRKLTSSPNQDYTEEISRSVVGYRSRHFDDFLRVSYLATETSLL